MHRITLILQHSTNTSGKAISVFRASRPTVSASDLHRSRLMIRCMRLRGAATNGNRTNLS